MNKLSGLLQSHLPSLCPQPWARLPWHQLHLHYSTRPPSIGGLLGSAPLGPARVQGWVRAARRQKRRTFLEVGDGSSPANLQVVADTSLLPPDLTFHSCVSIAGELRPSGHPQQEVELIASQVEVLAPCEPSYPFQPRQAASQEFVRGHPTCKAKTSSVSSLLRMRSLLSRTIHQYYQEREYLEVHTPILTTNDCEGGGEVFTVSAPPGLGGEEASYWDSPVHLTVSGQMHLEAICNGIARVYTFNPAFRAERGRTRRHLAEFWMVEAEVAFMEDVSSIVGEVEELVKGCATALLDRCAPDVDLYCRAAGAAGEGAGRLEGVARGAWHTLTYREAVELLTRAPLPPPRAGDLGREHELWLCEHLGGAVAVVEWPAGGKPPYMREVAGGAGLVEAVDILVPRVGELAGGSLREHCPTKLAKRLAWSGDRSLDWYVQLRREGAAPTGGYGLGFERLLQHLVGVEHIRDTLPFHRAPHSCPL